MWGAVELVAYVDDVVVAIGADAERADKPTPDAEPPLLAKWLAELEERPFARVVVAFDLPDAVAIHVERLLDAGREANSAPNRLWCAPLPHIGVERIRSPASSNLRR